MKDEIASLQKHETWEVVPRPPDKNIVSCKWVYRVKYNADGKITHFKARLVARGFTQVLSRTQLLLTKISQVVQEVRDINKYIGNKKTGSNNLFKPKGPPYKHKTSPGNDEQNGEDCKYFGGNKNMPQYQDPPDKPYTLKHCERGPPTSLPIPVLEPPAPGTIHAYPEAWSHSTSDSSSLVEPCSEDDISDPSSFCNSWPSDSPSGVMDSREGMDEGAGERLDLEGGGGTGIAKDCSQGEELRGETMIDCPWGEELRGEGAAPIQQVQGWDLKKDR